MSKLSFSPKSRRDLHAIFDYIAKDNPQAAVDVVGKIEEKVQFAGGGPRYGLRAG